jgi:glycine betaine/proline transport system permease protein
MTFVDKYIMALLEKKIPIGHWVKIFVEYITDHFANQFNMVSDNLEALLQGIIHLLSLIHPLLFILIVCAIAYAIHRKTSLAIGVALALLLIFNQGYWSETLDTCSLVLVSTIVSVVLGIPIGIISAHRPIIFTCIRPFLDLMQTIPTFVYLIPTLMLFGLGMVPGMISTVIFSIPAPIRLTYLGISSVPQQLIDAGKSFGSSPFQMLYKVELPHAMPTIMAGLTQCIMLSLSMVVIAALVGADGLGKPVIRALNTVNIAQGFEAGLAIVILAIILDRLLKQPGNVDYNY